MNRIVHQSYEDGRQSQYLDAISKAGIMNKIGRSAAKIRHKIRKFINRTIGRDKVRSHPVVGVSVLSSGRNIVQIQQEEIVKIFKNDVDDGYHGFGTQWWTNISCPNSFKYLSLDAMYAPAYFEEGRGHPSYDNSKKLYDYMQEVYTELFGRQFGSVLELGTGGGEITRHFNENHIEFVAVEGTTSGIDKLLELGIPQERILKRNLKFLEHLNARFDLSMCTEVAEHIEPWFASKIVSNCVEHSDVVWFSAANGDARPHYHHINEVPLAAWDNIFAHFGFVFFAELNGTADRADRIYLNAKAASRAFEHSRLSSSQADAGTPNGPNG